MKGKVCEYCGKNPGAKPGNKDMWKGFLDKDTNQFGIQVNVTVSGETETLADGKEITL